MRTENIFSLAQVDIFKSLLSVGDHPPCQIDFARILSFSI